MISKLSHRGNVRFMGALAILVLALSAVAPAFADTVTKRVTFVHDVVIGGTKVAAGDYHLVIGDGRLAVIDGKHMVANATATWVVRDDQADRDSVMYADNYHVAEIRFAHQRNVLIIAAP
jgi:ketosteroid isomerase-like protein